MNTLQALYHWVTSVPKIFLESQAVSVFSAVIPAHGRWRQKDQSSRPASAKQGVHGQYEDPV